MNNCFPAGVPRIMLLRVFQMLHLPDQVLMLFEYEHGVRRIYMDGRAHPDGYPPGWMGHSIGRWDGDTLVVDTAALNDRTWMPGSAPAVSGARQRPPWCWWRSPMHSTSTW